jgi:DNA helicase-2/ATP-dependent DNA helicase PcrA
MPLPNRIIVASAGSGKTTTIIDVACADSGSRAALVTHTTNNTSGIEKMLYSKIGHIPPHLTVSTWYTFLLRHLVRPYQRSLHPQPVKRLHFHNGISAQWSKEADVTAHYFGGVGCIYVDKVSKLACQIIDKTCGKPIRRLEDIFDHL